MVASAVLNDAERALGLELVGADARGPEEIDPAFAAMAAAGVDSFFPLAEATLITPRQCFNASSS